MGRTSAGGFQSRSLLITGDDHKSSFPNGHLQTRSVDLFLVGYKDSNTLRESLVMLCTISTVCKHGSPVLFRAVSSGVPLNRPSPPPLPREEQREFERLLQAAQTPLSVKDGEVDIHPDARTPIQPDFEGDVNPRTGERGGPKKEPVKKWGSEGDWSQSGRVTDF